ncbi:MAG: hypothetical protein KGO82_05635 [Bacteroidota bacterium]|nr:hypothetical protein [Bacteroidota bacterium]
MTDRLKAGGLRSPNAATFYFACQSRAVAIISADIWFNIFAKRMEKQGHLLGHWYQGFQIEAFFHVHAIIAAGILAISTDQMKRFRYCAEMYKFVGSLGLYWF